MLVLDDTDDEAGSVETIGEEEECTEVGKGVTKRLVVCLSVCLDPSQKVSYSRESLVLVGSFVNLFPTKLSVSSAFRKEKREEGQGMKQARKRCGE
jgi:hypothetical protein